MSEASLPKINLGADGGSDTDPAVSTVIGVGRNRTLTLFVGALTVVTLLVLAWMGFELWRGFSPTRPLGRIVSLLWFDMVILVALGTFIAVQGYYTWTDIRARLSGTQVYRRVVLFLIVVASLPTLEVSRLVSFVESGGGLLIGAGDNVDPDRWNALYSELLPRPVRSITVLSERDDPDASIKATRIATRMKTVRKRTSPS